MVVKNLCILVIGILMSIESHGQGESYMLGEFLITEAFLNNEDFTTVVLKEGAYSTFYTSEGESKLNLANIFPKSGTKSYGELFDLTYIQTPQTQSSFESDRISGKWNYHNTYNSEIGTAQVEFIKIYTTEGTYFELIITTKFDFIIYRGLLKGVVDFSSYTL